MALTMGPLLWYTRDMPDRHRVAQRAPRIEVLLEPGRDGQPLYLQLYQQLRAHIVEGVLPSGAGLPAARLMASDLHLSRNTVEAAIGRLCSEGLVERRVGAGTFVTTMHETTPFLERATMRRGGSRPVRRTGRSGQAPARTPTVDIAQDTTLKSDRLSASGAVLDALGARERMLDQRTGPCTTDVTGFPLQSWNRIVSRVARRLGVSALQADDVQGNVRLREAIAEHVRLTRGVRCAPSQIVVVNSTQQALDTLTRLFVSAGDDVLVEEPCYRSARALLLAAGATVHGIPVDREGLQTDALAAHTVARLLYLTPSHQYPLGTTLTLRRRMAALAWARATGALIVEDDYDSEFRHDGRPIAALQGLDSAGRVIYLGTFNKVLFPAIRLAYAVLPETLVDAFVNARKMLDGGPPTLMQEALATFLAGGHFGAYLRRARELYASRRECLLACLSAHSPHRWVVGTHGTGLHLVVMLQHDLDDMTIAAECGGCGLGVTGLSGYFGDATPMQQRTRGLVISYGGVPDHAIRAGVDIIAGVVARHAAALHRSRAG